MENQTNVDELSDREAATELAPIIRNRGAGDRELEASLQSYTRGVELLRSLRGRLADAEQKVSVLMADIDGNDVLQPADAASTEDKPSFL